MDIQNFLIAFQHINWQRILRNYHERHYIWEIAKVLIPALVTGIITFIAMRLIDNKNKKRWLNDGHMKRKTDLEIEIRKFLLSIKANTSDKYEILVDLYNPKCTVEPDDIDSKILYDFNRDFDTVSIYLETEENKKNANVYDDSSIFALMDEYVCYVPKIKPLFDDFKAICKELTYLKTIHQNYNSNSQINILNCDVKTIVERRPEHFDKMANTYLCFQVATDRILKKIMDKKVIK